MSKEEGEGKRRVRLTPEVIEDWLVHGKTIETDLPDDARLIDHWMNTESWLYVFLFESSQWTPLEEGAYIPTAEVNIIDDCPVCHECHEVRFWDEENKEYNCPMCDR